LIHRTRECWKSDSCRCNQHSHYERIRWENVTYAQWEQSGSSVALTIRRLPYYSEPQEEIERSVDVRDICCLTDKLSDGGCSEVRIGTPSGIWKLVYGSVPERYRTQIWWVREPIALRLSGVPVRSIYLIPPLAADEFEQWVKDRFEWGIYPNLKEPACLPKRYRGWGHPYRTFIE